MSEEDASACPKHESVDGPSLFQNGDLVFQTHHVGWIVASFFTLIAVVTSAWLVCKHLMWYTNKREQRYIIRILLLVPVYAIISLLSYFFWTHATPLLLVRDCYESTVLTAFFYLLLYYLSPHTDEQRAIFLKKGLSRERDRMTPAGEKRKTWVWPMGWVKWKPSDGLYFLQWMKWGVLQYCVVRPLTTLMAVILEYKDLYCEASWGMGFGHVYVVIIVSISVTIAMYCLIQLYVVVSDELKSYRPLLKLFAIKAVVFLTFWQASFLSVLTMFDVIKDTKYMTAEDINIGIGALLETFEMAVFAFIHIRAFTYKPYRPFHAPDSDEPPPERTPMLRSFLHAMDFRETFREIWQGCKYMWAQMRGREPKMDQGARRFAHYQGAFGKSRTIDGSRSAVLVSKHTVIEKSPPETKATATLPAVHLDVAAEERTERIWLGLGDSGIRRQQSEGLEEQIEKELEKRGYASRIPGRGHIKATPSFADEPEYGHQRQRSWWRNIYNRISQSGHEADLEEARRSAVSSRHRKLRNDPRHRRDTRDAEAERMLLSDPNQYDFDDPPPPSLIRQSRRQQQLAPDYHQGGRGIHSQDDVLAPLTMYAEHQSSHVYRQRNLASPPPQQHGRTSQPSSPHAVNSYPYSPSLVHEVRSTENLWGRVFPPSTDHATSEYGIHSTQTPSMHDIGIAGERNTWDAQVESSGPSAGIPVEIIHPQGSHNRQSAFHDLDPVDPIAQSHMDRNSTPPASPKRSKALRRNSATPSPVSASPRSSVPHRHDSIPTPHHAYIPQPFNRPKRIVLPGPLSPTAYPSPLHTFPSARYSDSNPDSTLTQPSFSATRQVAKYPVDTNYSAAVSSDDNLSRYPGLPRSPPHSPGQYHLSNDNYRP